MPCTLFHSPRPQALGIVLCLQGTHLSVLLALTGEGHLEHVPCLFTTLQMPQWQLPLCSGSTAASLLHSTQHMLQGGWVNRTLHWDLLAYVRTKGEMGDILRDQRIKGRACCPGAADHTVLLCLGCKAREGRTGRGEWGF